MFNVPTSFFCSDKTLDQKQLRGKEMFAEFIVLGNSSAFRSQVRNLEQKPWGIATSWLALWLMLSWLSYMPQAHQPMDGTAHSALSPPSYATHEQRQSLTNTDIGPSDSSNSYSEEGSPFPGDFRPC